MCVTTSLFSMLVLFFFIEREPEHLGPADKVSFSVVCSCTIGH